MNVPSQLICIRHGQSSLNVLQFKKQKDPDYKKFLEILEKYKYDYSVSAGYAKCVSEKYTSNTSDRESGITWLGGRQSVITGQALKKQLTVPDVIVVSPYKRCRSTFEAMKLGWPELEKVNCVFYDDRIREQDTGEVYLYGDMDAFFILNPEQHKIFKMNGRYFYRFPNGENIPDIRLRLKIWFNDICKNFSGKNILIISHFTTLMSLKANLKEWGEEEFLTYHENTRLINCGVSIYDATLEETYKSRYFNKIFYKI